MNVNGYPPLMKAEEVADALGVSRTTVYELMKARLLPEVNVGGIRRIDREKLFDLIEGGSLESVLDPDGAGQEVVEDSDRRHTRTLRRRI